jgi:hypothetical protein
MDSDGTPSDKSIMASCIQAKRGGGSAPALLFEGSGIMKCGVFSVGTIADRGIFFLLVAGRLVSNRNRLGAARCR